jgi:hypothetical protein
MSNARLWLAFAGETMFPPFFWQAWGTSLHAHRPTEVGR